MDQLPHVVWPQELLHLARVKPGLVWGMYSEPSFLKDCPNCGGIGRMSAFVIADSTPDKTPLISRWMDGRMYHGYSVWADCPVCNGDARGAWLARMCGLEGDELNVRLDGFFPADGKREGRDVAAGLLAQTPTPHGFVSFVGGFGVGKSHLLKALVNGFRLAGVVSVYIPSGGDLLASVREMFGRESSDAADTLIARYKGYRVLVLDEVDRFNPTPWALDVIFRVLNARYDRRAEYLTVLASNQTPAQMEGGPLGYLASRMNGGVLATVAGDDMREA